MSERFWKSCATSLYKTVLNVAFFLSVMSYLTAVAVLFSGVQNMSDLPGLRIFVPSGSSFIYIYLTELH